MLEKFKASCIDIGIKEMGHFWELSDEIIDRIEGSKYVANKIAHNEYLKINRLWQRKSL